MSEVKSYHYFDHNATTPLFLEVKELVKSQIENWGNPSSIHWAGRNPKNILREARNLLSQNLNCNSLELIFTSGGSEGNNTILKSVFETLGSDKPHFITSAVEHPSVLKTLRYLETKGAILSIVPVNKKGELDIEYYKKVLTPNTALVSIMYANNETGVLFPIKKLAELAHEQGALFHTDAVQAFGKINLDLKDLGVDYASFSAHKFYALKGTGFIYSKKGAPLSSLIHGGGQERGRRAGTENILGISALGEVAKKLSLINEMSSKINFIREHLEIRILSEIPHSRITNFESRRLPNTSSFVIDGIDGETLLMSLDLKGYAVSTGAACSSGSPEPSPVLIAMGLTREEAQSSLRISLGWANSIEEVNEFIDVLKQVVFRLRQIQKEEVMLNDL